MCRSVTHVDVIWRYDLRYVNGRLDRRLTNEQFVMPIDSTVLGWVTVSAGNLSQSNQPSRSTQPGHPYVGKHNEYRSKGGDAL